MQDDVQHVLHELASNAKQEGGAIKDTLGRLGRQALQIVDSQFCTGFGTCMNVCA
jgi:Pyruvate/2-oxoacid:ferredoxin oxidoreductase delta subunit